MSYIFPSSFVRSLNEKFNLEEKAFVDAHEQPEQITSIRLNPFKPIDSFAGQQVVPWSRHGRYLEVRPSFVADPLFHAGCYYVQEASSMFLEHILEQVVNLDDDLRVLDLCAAPGGKSTLIASLLNQQSLLVSNEIIKTRVPVLSDNLSRWGTTNCVVSNNDPKSFGRLEGYFDVMVVDAPCSGSGMWRKDPQTIGEWSESAVQLCSQRQQRILADAYPALKKGGILIYSTCSYSPEENEEIADWLCDEFDLSPVRIPVDPAWGIVETISSKHHCHGYRFYPHKVKGEGFFITCLKKNDGQYDAAMRRGRPEKISREIQDILNNWTSWGEEYVHLPAKEGFSIIYKQHLADIQFLQSKLYLKKSGVYAGRLAGRDLIPDQELAVSLLVRPEVNRINLDLADALRYLRRDELQPGAASKGWTLMCYQNFGLGWAKVLNNRVNNYYPKEMRILKEF